jgi:hypothetical protein
MIPDRAISQKDTEGLAEEQLEELTLKTFTL